MLKLKRTLENSAIGIKGYAKLLDMADRTLYNKLIGASDFSYPEYQKLRALLPQYNIDYLLTAEQASKDSA